MCTRARGPSDAPTRQAEWRAVRKAARHCSGARPRTAGAPRTRPRPRRRTSSVDRCMPPRPAAAPVSVLNWPPSYKSDAPSAAPGETVDALRDASGSGRGPGRPRPPEPRRIAAWSGSATLPGRGARRRASGTVANRRRRPDAPRRASGSAAVLGGYAGPARADAERRQRAAVRLDAGSGIRLAVARRGEYAAARRPWSTSRRATAGRRAGPCGRRPAASCGVGHPVLPPGAYGPASTERRPLGAVGRPARRPADRASDRRQSPLGSHGGCNDPTRTGGCAIGSRDAGYLRDHPVGGCWSRPIALHDTRPRFEVYCYSGAGGEAGRRSAGTARAPRRILAERAAGAFGRTRCSSGSGRPDRRAGDSGRARFGPRARLTLFARRPAPVQVSGFGYCGDDRGRAIDYRLTDAGPTRRATRPTGTTPSGSGGCRTVCWCYRPVRAGRGRRPAAGRGRRARDVRCRLNNPVKMTDAVVAVWPGVLAAVPGSRLLLLGSARRPGAGPAVRGPGGSTPIGSRWPAGGRGPGTSSCINRIDVGLDRSRSTGTTRCATDVDGGCGGVGVAAGRAGFAARRVWSHLCRAVGCGPGRPDGGRVRRRWAAGLAVGR
jgi:hypothetical protein